MRVLILEDEYHAASRIQRLLQSNIQDLDIVAVLDSVEEATSFLTENKDIDLIFADIQLADGLSFSVLQDLNVQTPVIFTTAFDQYTLKAFKLNSIDYLLKPIDEEELKSAINKYTQLKEGNSNNSLLKVLESFQSQKAFKERFLIKNKDEYIFLLSEEIAYFFSEDSLTFIMSTSGKKYIYDHTLNSIESELDPALFHRINRKQIVRISSVSTISSYFNNRVKLEVKPSSDQEFIVSREKVKAFKVWLGG